MKPINFHAAAVKLLYKTHYNEPADRGFRDYSYATATVTAYAYAHATTATYAHAYAYDYACATASAYASTSAATAYASHIGYATSTRARYTVAIRYFPIIILKQYMDDKESGVDYE